MIHVDNVLWYNPISCFIYSRPIISSGRKGLNSEVKKTSSKTFRSVKVENCLSRDFQHQCYLIFDLNQHLIHFWPLPVHQFSRMIIYRFSQALKRSFRSCTFDAATSSRLARVDFQQSVIYLWCPESWGSILLKILYPCLELESYEKTTEGVMNGPLKFSTARKILPLLDLLAKF